MISADCMIGGRWGMGRRGAACRGRSAAHNVEVSLYRDEGVVLRAQKLGEADRIVTLLTREHGRVRAVAKGVRKTTSRLGARVEPFMLVDVQLYEGRSLDIITQAETIGPYGTAIASDYPATPPAPPCSRPPSG